MLRISKALVTLNKMGLFTFCEQKRPQRVFAPRREDSKFKGYPKKQEKHQTDEDAQVTKPSKPREKQLFMKSAQHPERATRLFNQFIQRKEEHKSNQATLQKQLEQLKNQQLTASNVVNQIQILDKLLDLQQIEKLYEEYSKQGQIDFNVLNNYFQAISKLSVSRDSYLKLKENLISLKEQANQLSSETYQNFYYLIFAMNASGLQKITELEFLHNLMVQYSIQFPFTDLSQFSLLFDEDRQVSNPKSHLKTVQVFNLYFQKYSELAKNKHPDQLPNIRVIFRIAVDQALRYEVMEGQKILQSLKKCQQYYENHLELADLVKFCKFLAARKNQYKQIVDICKNVKKAQFIYDFDLALKQLDKDGQEIQCITPEELEKYYVDHKGRFPLRVLELTSIMAERFGQNNIIADIFLNAKSQKQEEYSQIIYQKAINIILDSCDQKNVRNSVMNLMQEAQNNKVPLNRFQYALNQIKASIKEDNYSTAFKLFTNNIIEDVIREFQKEKIKRLLYRYIQYNVVGERNFSQIESLSDYSLRMKEVDRFVSKLDHIQLDKLFKNESSDNYILEAIINNNDIFAYSKGVKQRQVFQRIKQLATLNQYNYQQLVNAQDEELLEEKEILMNYEYYVSLEKQNLIKERKQERVNQILNQINQYAFVRQSKEEIEREINKVFTNEELEAGLLETDSLEFPELEQIKIYQEYILKNDTQQVQQQQQQQQQQQEQTIELIQDEELEQLQIEVEKDNEREEQPLGLADMYGDAVAESEKKPSDQQIELQKKVLQIVDRILQEEHDLQYDDKKRKEYIRENIGMSDQYDNMIDQFYYDENGYVPYQKYNKKPYEPYRDTSDFDNKIDTMYLNKGIDMADFLRMKYIYHGNYNGYNYYIRLKASQQQDEIWNLMAWGIKNKEPFAIRLGEYYANLTGIKVPHYMGQAIADFYKYEVGDANSEIRQKWVQTYQVAGNVDVAKVYNHQDSAFISQKDIEILLNLETQPQYKGLARSLLRTSYAQHKYKRYGVTYKDILSSY